MAPSPELGGQPKAPDKAGADQPSSNPTTTSEHMPSSLSSSSSSSASASSNSNNPPQSSGTKNAPSAGTTAGTSNSGSSNNYTSSTSSSTGAGGGGAGAIPAAGALAGTLPAQATTPQQDSSKIDNMEENDLKALLEEAITYKRPKDREHKSATFNELLSKTEMEDKEQNFSFTSRAIQTKRASGRPTQGGSLQDLPEASLQEFLYTEFPSDGNRGAFSQNWQRRHQGGSSGAASVGPGGGDRATNPRQKRTTSSVSSRQREGGSLPSNVNVECSFFNDVGHHHTTGTFTKFKKREGGSKSDYGTMVLTAPLMTSAGAADLISAVAEVAGSTGLKNTESQLIDGCGTGVGSGHTVIDMGELESDETQSLLAHDALQQTLYDSGLDDYDGSGGDLYGSSTTTIGGSSTTGGTGTGCSAMKKIPRCPATSYTSHVNLEIGEPSSTVRPSSVHHVDKTVSLPLLESNKSVDITSIQLGTNYQAVKCFVSSDNSKSDQTRVMMGSSNPKYTATSIGQVISQVRQKCLDENGNSVQQFNSGLGSSSATAGVGGGLVGSGNSSSVGGIAGGKKKRKPVSDRNTVLVIPEKIAGYRGKDHDIESLVCYIENKDKQKDGSKGGGGASGSNPKNGTIMKVGSASVENGIPEEKVPKKKNEKKKEKAKLKKSNSLEELSSCSRKKQQAEEEQNTQKNQVAEQHQQQGSAQKSQDAESAVTLRSGKGNKKAQSNVSSSIPSSVSSASSTTSSHSSKETSVISGKRGERRSWGTEELSYLEDSHNQNSQGVEKSEEKPAKKESRKEAKENAELATPTFNAGKKRDSLRMSVESLSAISAGMGSETAEFHVVTKKKKMKKKAHSLFAEDTTSSATGGYSNAASNANNRRHLTVSQSYNLGSSTVRSSNISGKYQTSNSFINDREVYMNSLTSSNDVSRRKSTSSVPPSEKSDSSDADSVQSLPIEPSRKQQQQQQHQSHQSGAGRNSSAGVPQSYADIARIPNADRINNNLIGATSNSSTSPLDSSSVEKWPPVQATTSEDLAQALKSPSAFPELVPESSSLQQSQQQSQPLNPQQYQQHQYVNSSVSSNNLGNNNKATYSQSLLIATTKAVEEDDTANRLQQQQRLATASSGKLVSSVNSEHSVNISSSNNSSNISSSKLALHKSKSVDTNDIYYSNEHYPALEKTVKPAKAAPTVTANSNSLQEPKASSTGKVSPIANAGQLQQNALSQPTNAPTATTTVISGNPIASNVSTGAKKSKKKDLITATTTTTVTAAATTPSIPPNEVETINNARNVASTVQTSLDAANNNPLLIENIDNVLSTDFPQNGMLLNRSPNGSLNVQQPPLQSTPKNSGPITSPTSSVTSNAASSKRSKKEKINTMLSQNSTTSAAGTNHAATATANSNHRPAVIIMNDHNESNSSHEFTFGFDIDQELLFGDFQEDEVTMLDQQSQQQQHQYHHQQKPSQHHSNNSSTDNVPSPTSNTSAHSTDLGYSSMQQSSTSTASPTSSNSSQHKPTHHHHYHNQPTQPQLESYEILHSADPDTYRDGIEHKFHQPPPPMVPAMYTQPPPQLPPPHMLAAAQQQSSRQPRPAGPNQYNLPPPPVIPTHIQQQPPPALPVVAPAAAAPAAKQDTATNTPAAIMSVPPPPLPPVVVPAATIPIVQAVILPAGPPPVSMNAVVTSSSSNINSAVAAGAGSSISSNNSSSSSNIHTSLNNQTVPSSSGSSNSINSCSSASLQQEPKPQQQQQLNSAQPPVREKMKEINLRFIAPEQLQTNHNHDKIVHFVGMAWEDVICGTNGSAKYYEGQ
ncbi:nuclear pore complex protein DDB_G0274915 isoform X1 [Aedes aegypti]|uniref:Uncharacterized protein n=2 Tax=Aedes aegypti TaxID=7159 RepID=A0A6I8TRG4_AEDAE|nr:nuclear pore complex protein DDB_G0274915 isoform X1 [Aedes aegypti]XP_021711100.1 nuclear pore complex protein DDB_G0274915 isoform X1 [Aedes aegypti]XP_021711101.1 nuclear pore complex protein DDB_G0274915 isoform X1 [Aedes aegypti]XP_021711102.1 nuclear pore complex protein DDB_G0274915 isoform X1 [Aedes aegypti]